MDHNSNFQICKNNGGQLQIQWIPQRNELTRITILPDDNCYFRALSHQLYGSQNSHFKIRQQICQYISENKAEYQKYLDEPIEEFLKDLAKLRSWGGEHCLAASAEIYKCMIIVYQENQNPLLYHPFADHMNNAKRLYLEYINENHFNSLVLKRDNNSRDELKLSRENEFYSTSKLSLDSSTSTNAIQQPYDFKTRSSTALELEQAEIILTTGCCNLDKYLKGGIPGFGLTEIVGPSGTGKTLIALQLCLTVQLPIISGGLDADAVYINIQKPFPSRRLVELTKYFQTKFSLSDDPMDKIIVENVTDSNSLIYSVTRRLPVLLKEGKRKIGLVVVDSIASVFKTEYNFNQKERANDLRLIGRTLHDLASRNSFALIVVNQVSGEVGPSSFGETPSLGLLWKSIVTTRIQLYQKEEKRFICIPFSPHIPNRNIPYEICSDGVRHLQQTK